MRIRFDRGTLVIDQAPSNIDPEQFSGATWDDDLAAWRLPAERLSDVRGRLAARSVRVSDDIAPPSITGQWSLPDLRWYQRDALGAWRDSGDRGVIVLPTGAGKTVVALAAIAELAVATLVLVPTRILLDQWARALEAAWPHPIGRIGDGDHRVGEITVATYASAVTWAPRLGDRFGLVIVDEAHHVGAWCPAEIFEMLVAPARLGLTATPPGGSAAWSLARRIGPTVYTLGVEALRGTALADYTHETIAVDLDPVERNAYKRLRGQFGSFYAGAQRGQRLPWRQFVRDAQRSLAGRDALAAWRASRALLSYPSAKRMQLHDLLQRHTGERILIFTADNATAYAIARELLVVPITCDIGRTERVEMLARYRAGDVSVLVSAQVLDEGFDVPDAEVAIIVGGTSSQRRHAQRIGRVLRPRAGKRAHVYELVVADSAELRQVQRRRGANANADTRDTPLELPLVIRSGGAAAGSDASQATERPPVIRPDVAAGSDASRPLAPPPVLRRRKMNASEGTQDPQRRLSFRRAPNTAEGAYEPQPPLPFRRASNTIEGARGPNDVPNAALSERDDAEPTEAVS
jgi:superfamily II DNA or RNA helicase